MTKYTPSPGKTNLYTLPFHLTALCITAGIMTLKKKWPYNRRIFPKAPNFEAVPIPGLYWIDIFAILIQTRFCSEHVLRGFT